MEIARTENIENEGLVKHYDPQGRLVKIEFTRSGNSCTIQYPTVPASPVSAFLSQTRLVTWSNGYRYLVYTNGDHTSFKDMSKVKPNEPAWDDMKFEETSR
jgi:hypothetical protein